MSNELKNMNEKVIDLSKLSDKLISENESLKRSLNEVFKKEELNKMKQDNIKQVNFYYLNK